MTPGRITFVFFPAATAYIYAVYVVIAPAILSLLKVGFAVDSIQYMYALLAKFTDC